MLCEIIDTWPETENLMGVCMLDTCGEEITILVDPASSTVTSYIGNYRPGEQRAIVSAVDTEIKRQIERAQDQEGNL